VVQCGVNLLLFFFPQVADKDLAPLLLSSGCRRERGLKNTAQTKPGARFLYVCSTSFHRLYKAEKVKNRLKRLKTA
jgi:hypothetical protein